MNAFMYEGCVPPLRYMTRVYRPRSIRTFLHAQPHPQATAHVRASLVICSSQRKWFRLFAYISMSLERYTSWIHIYKASHNYIKFPCAYFSFITPRYFIMLDLEYRNGSARQRSLFSISLFYFIYTRKKRFC